MSTRVRHERMDIWLNRQLGIFFQFPLICQHVLNSNIENIWQPVWRVSVSISIEQLEVSRKESVKFCFHAAGSKTCVDYSLALTTLKFSRSKPALRK